MDGTPTQADKAAALVAKQKGNEHFAKQQWAEAVGCYSSAHISDPTEPTYPLNRAMAYIKLNKFIDAERDCTTALSLSPNNVKALYRRATARMGAGKLQEAKQDYEEVLRLDPKNVEAKAGLAKAQQKIESTKPPRKEPIDLQKLSGKSDVGVTNASSAFEANPVLGSYASQASAASNGSSSSVEAARKFLQQVGMSSESDEADAQPPSKTSKSTLPSKFPGETGGFLREVTTRKTSDKPASKSIEPTMSSTPTSARITSTEPTASTAASSQGTSIKKTASALNFGASPSQSNSVTPIPRATARTSQASGKMSSIEFTRRWKLKPERLALLSSIDADSIPGMIDTMLEPELVAEILQALADGHRASTGDGNLTELIKAVLTALPKCKRFGMAVAMLDSTEKSNAAYLIDAVGRPEWKKVWEVA